MLIEQLLQKATLPEITLEVLQKMTPRDLHNLETPRLVVTSSTHSTEGRLAVVLPYDEWEEFNLVILKLAKYIDTCCPPDMIQSFKTILTDKDTNTIS